MSALRNILLCRNFAQRMINQRQLLLAPTFIADTSVHHELGSALPPLLRQLAHDPAS